METAESKLDRDIETIEEGLACAMPAPRSGNAASQTDGLFLSHEDVQSVHTEDDALISIKAPPDTTCEFSDATQQDKQPDMLHQIFLKSTGGAIHANLIQPQAISIVKTVHA